VTGVINGSLQAAIKKDGSIEFPAVIPGLYNMRLTGVSGFPAMNVVVAGWDTTEVKVVVPAR